MIREDIYSKEAVLVNQARRELANGRYKNPIHKLRLQCFARGGNGILEFAKIFRVMTDDGNRELSKEEFKKGIIDTGIEASDADIDNLFELFDRDGKNTINITEIIVKLRPIMNNSRCNIINQAFKKVDVNNDGQITVANLKNIYNVRDNPKYLSGELTETEILNKFLNCFDNGSDEINGIITKEEFINYYASISASIDDDAYFDLMMRRSYKL